MGIRVAFIAAECEPWAKTGGLADVVDALARALGQLPGGDVEAPVDVFLPRYRGMREPDDLVRATVVVPDASNGGRPIEVGILSAETHGYRVHFVDHPPAFDRDGMYGSPDSDHPDNGWRFGLLCRAALAALQASATKVDVLHLHDWHAVPALLLRDRVLASDPIVGGAAVVLSVHNLAYHGWTPAERVGELGLGAGAIARGAPGLDLLLAGIQGSDLVNTVSPGFAKEALTPDFGMGLDGALRAKGDRFLGILNGLDTDLWDPETDETLPARYSRENRGGKAACRTSLLAELGLDPEDPRPVLSMIGRLDRQKGFDLLAAATPALLERGVRLAVLGSGNPEVVGPLRSLAGSSANRGRIALLERFDRNLARRMYAGTDGFLMPSRFEPCGTGQMISLRYGTPPVVRATGGLRDTVIDVDANPATGTGFVFEGDAPDALVDACARFAARFERGGPSWESLLDRGMAVDFDWRRSSGPAYVDAYHGAIALRDGVTAP
ncbi:MAG TPA: glycogen/starch synthase [Candidatus Limnocylindria bacterium]|nr:glycogen/starch synthase [Candidatus Limnocylindria bacterium]